MDALRECSPELLERATQTEPTASSGSIVLIRSHSFPLRPCSVAGDTLSPIELAETPSSYSIVVPLLGVDPRKVYVFAMPTLVTIEIHCRSGICHQLNDTPVIETIDRRISREFSFPIEIEKGGTVVQVCGESLEITAAKIGANPPSFVVAADPFRYARAVRL